MRLVFAVLAVAAMACGTEEPPPDRVTVIQDLTGDVANGEAVYSVSCALCHLEDGTGETNGGVGDDLTQKFASTDDEAEYIGTIINGEGDMTAFGDDLTDQEIADVMAYMADAFGS